MKKHSWRPKQTWPPEWHPNHAGKVRGTADILRCFQSRKSKTKAKFSKWWLARNLQSSLLHLPKTTMQWTKWLFFFFQPAFPHENKIQCQRPRKRSKPPYSSPEQPLLTGTSSATPEKERCWGLAKANSKGGSVTAPFSVCLNTSINKIPSPATRSQKPSSWLADLYQRVRASPRTAALGLTELVWQMSFAFAC